MPILADVTEEVSALSTLLTSIGSVITQMFTWIGDWFEMWTDIDVLVLFLALAIVGTIFGFGISLFRSRV